MEPLITCFLRFSARLWCGVLLTYSSPLMAQTSADPSGYVAKCQSCHSLRSSGSQFAPLLPSQNNVAVYGTTTPPIQVPGKIINWSALSDKTSDDLIIAAMRDKNSIPPTSGMYGYFDFYIGDGFHDGNASNAQLLSIYHYLRQVRDAEVSIGTHNPTISETAVGLSSTSSVTVSIQNYRATALNYRFDIAAISANIVPGNPSASEFMVSPSSGTCGGTSTSTPTTCTINVLVTFKPQQASPRSATMSVVLESANAADPAPGATRPDLLLSRRINLAGSGIVPLTVSINTGPLAGTLSFTTVANISTPRSIFIGNRGSTSLTITPILNAEATAAGYTIAPSSTCQPRTVLTANGTPCTLTVNFLPLTAVTATTDAKLLIEYDGFNSPRIIPLDGVATAEPRARIELSTQSVSMGEVFVGSSAPTQTIIVHNGGQASLQLNSLVPGGTGQSDFERGGTCNTGTALQVGPASNNNTNCTIELTFKPTAVGPRNAVILINSNAVNTPIELTLTGSGKAVPTPRLELSPAGQLDFGLQTIGGIYPARSVTLKNSGDAALSIGGIVIDGTTFTNVSAVACPASLASGASCAIDIRFKPTVAGVNYASTLRINSNAPGSPQNLALLGSSTATTVPVLEWTQPVGTALDFGPVSAGTVSDTQSVSFINRGPGGVDLSVVNAVGADAAAFAVDTTGCAVGTPLFQDTPCSVNIRFSPGSAGTKTATLQIVSSGSPPATLNLTGTGLGNPAAALVLSATTMVFDRVRVGALSVPVELTLSATGPSAVNVTGLQINGPYSVQNKTCAAVPFQLNAGGSCTVTITFRPQTQGSASGTLRVTSDVAPAEVTLSGTGEAEPNLSSGGCSMVSGDAPFDPTLWLLILLAAGAIAYRRHARAAGRRP